MALGISLKRSVFDQCVYNVDNIVYLVENGGGGCYNALVCYYWRPARAARLHPKRGAQCAAVCGDATRRGQPGQTGQNAPAAPPAYADCGLWRLRLHK